MRARAERQQRADLVQGETEIAEPGFESAHLVGF